MNLLPLPDTDPAAEVVPAVQSQPLVLLDREKEILAFNARVLAQACREDVPLLERLRYITIVSSNFDEFFEVRFADLMEAARLPGTAVSAGELQSLADDARALVQEQYALFNEDVMPALAHAGLVVLGHSARDAAQRHWVARYFQEQVKPLLVPVGPQRRRLGEPQHAALRRGGLADARRRAAPARHRRVPGAVPARHARRLSAAARWPLAQPGRAGRHQRTASADGPVPEVRREETA